MIDVDKKVYDTIKLKMLKDNLDPFVEKFVETQIVSIELLKWFTNFISDWKTILKCEHQKTILASWK